mmetsp:Transcript_40859/g.88520  ORF Transcript_40859/g.88520 Transcript_40859/m.88520 type:complete len:249 (-) Transcript_40859:360-1106(-)
MRLNTPSRNLLSASMSCSISSAKFKMSLSLASANVSTTTATMRFNTPKTKVRRLPTKIMAVAGYASMTGTAMVPQESPAMTVLKRRRFASMTEEVARRHCGHSWKTSGSLRCISLISGKMISTMSMAQMVMTTKQKMKDHAKAFKQVDIMVTNFCSSRNARVFLKSCSKRMTRAKRNKRRIPILAANSPSGMKKSITISVKPQTMTPTSNRKIQSIKATEPCQDNIRPSSMEYKTKHKPAAICSVGFT